LSDFTQSSKRNRGIAGLACLNCVILAALGWGFSVNILADAVLTLGGVILIGVIVSQIWFVADRSTKSSDSPVIVLLVAIVFLAGLASAITASAIGSNWIWQFSSGPVRPNSMPIQAPLKTGLEGFLFYNSELIGFLVEEFIVLVFVFFEFFLVVRLLLLVTQSILFSPIRTKLPNLLREDVVIRKVGVDTMLNITACVAGILFLDRAIVNSFSPWWLAHLPGAFIFGSVGMFFVWQLAQLRMPIAVANTLAVVCILALARFGAWADQFDWHPRLVVIFDGMIPWKNSIGWTIALAGTWMVNSFLWSLLPKLSTIPTIENQ
jgi:hypothetical protein